MKTWNQITPKQRIERWENVLRVLREMSPHERRKHFDMAHWGYKTVCGTVACAGGHCGLDPWFRRRGFKLTVPTKIFEVGGLFSNGDHRGFASEVIGFFGAQGASRIFMDATPRPVGTVIREVKQYLKELKAA